MMRGRAGSDAALNSTASAGPPTLPDAAVSLQGGGQTRQTIQKPREREGFKERKAERKMREFKQYLVDSGTLEALVKLLVGVQEAENRDRIDIQNLLQDFFGHFRDPDWDVVEGLWASIEKEEERTQELQARIAGIQGEIEVAARRLEAVELWRALAPDPKGEATSLPSMGGKDFLMRMCGLKKPQEGLVPPDQVLREKFVDWVDGLEDGPFRDWVLALKAPLRESPDAAPCGGERLTEPELLRFFQEVQECS